jgi:imidazolonepropionase-like amidohydrolase
MKPQLFTNVMIFDGEGTPCYPGEVLVDGNHIVTVARGADARIARDGAQVIDGEGATLMPGLCEAHSHVTYTNMTFLKEMGQIPPEEHLVRAIENAKLMLDSGFTSLYSAASAKWRTEIVLRNAINAGKFPGPRLRAASPEIVSTGGLGDESMLHMQNQGIEIVADGAEEIRKVVRTLIREGVDTIKLNISGDNFVRRGFGRQTSYTEGEVAAAAEEAHSRSTWLSCHARADGSVRLALKHGFRVIYHCDFIEGETFDLLEAAKDRIFLAPAIGVIYTTAYEAENFGITRAIAEHMEMFTMLENCPRVYGELRKRGMRILPGGDYGFAWNPIGTNARDLEHFVNILGFSPAGALSAATKWGGEIMNMPDLGLVKEGFLADLLLVRGDPVEDVRIMQDRDNLLMIMKDGVYHKHPQPTADRQPTRRARETVSVWG